MKNTGSGSYATAIRNIGASPAMTNVTASTSGASIQNFAVLNYGSSSPTMTNVTATASAGTAENHGVYNSSSSPTMTNVTATGSGGTNNYGVFNTLSSPTMTNVTATASGGTNNRGVYNTSSSPTMTNVTASASGGTNNYGVNSNVSGTIRINHSVIKGSTNTVMNYSGVTTYVGNTQLDGGPVSNSGTLICAGVYDENYAFSAGPACP